MSLWYKTYLNIYLNLNIWKWWMWLFSDNAVINLNSQIIWLLVYKSGRDIYNSVCIQVNCHNFTDRWKNTERKESFSQVSKLYNFSGDVNIVLWTSFNTFNLSSTSVYFFYFYSDKTMLFQPKAPSGSRATPWWGPMERSPGSSWIVVILGVKLNNIIYPQGWSYTLSYKQKCTVIDTILLPEKHFVTSFDNEIHLQITSGTKDLL